MADHDGCDPASVALAGDRLREGVRPVDVFAEIASRTGDWDGAVWAVCLALGLSAPDMRLLGSDPREVYAEFRPGEEDLCGRVLEMHGVFDVPRLLDERESEVRRLLKEAFGASGGISTGVALGLIRNLFKGELAAAFLCLARRQPRAPRGRPVDFWNALCAAGALLETGDDDQGRAVREALGRCRQNLADAAGAADGQVSSGA
ncbi:hypothetical protein ACFXAW_02070 [Streptomyces sp. NPDC059445]|uniref:hypothetical protein n=1 Tax=Streptomyces sp. NPDC059445 TaxID=3346832 RepID=UPI0036CE6507